MGDQTGFSQEKQQAASTKVVRPEFLGVRFGCFGYVIISAWRSRRSRSTRKLRKRVGVRKSCAMRVVRSSLRRRKACIMLGVRIRRLREQQNKKREENSNQLQNRHSALLKRSC